MSSWTLGAARGPQTPRGSDNQFLAPDRTTAGVESDSRRDGRPRGPSLLSARGICPRAAARHLASQCSDFSLMKFYSHYNSTVGICKEMTGSRKES